MQIFNQATHLKQIGQFEEAISHASQLPDSPTRSRLLLDIHLASGSDRNLKQAERVAKHWLKRQSSNPEPVQKLIEIQIQRREFMPALMACNELQRRLPGKGNADYFRAVINQLQGNFEKAAGLYLKSLKATNVPKSDGSMTAAAAQAVQAALLQCQTSYGNYPGSRESDTALLLDRPNELRHLQSRLLAWERSGVEEKRDAPDSERLAAAAAWANLGSTLTNAYSGANEAIDCLEHAIRLDPSHAQARTNLLYALNYPCGIDESEIMAEHKSHGAWLESRHDVSASRVVREPPGTEPARIKIAYLSSDFFTHSVAYFIAPVVFHHDKSQFEVHLFHTGKRSDQLTERFKNQVEHFHSVAGLNNQQLHQKIVQHDIDILVDLNGMTANNRLPILAARAAAVQVSWLGYPNTTGLPTMDFRIVDAITDPVEYAQSLATEKLVRMPKTFSVYDPLEPVPHVSDLPCLESGIVTFGCFNALSKFNDELVSVWSEILRSVPQSRLLLKNKGLTYPEQQRRLTGAFKANGIDSNRLGLMGMVANRSEHLACYHQVDISLDCFPYNGTTTNCESLLMGVPVIGLTGKGHRSRVTASQLHAVGLDRLVADSREEYVQIAVQLAADQSGLQQIRKDLRNTLLSSTLSDAAGFTRELEARFSDMVAGSLVYPEIQP